MAFWCPDTDPAFDTRACARTGSWRKRSQPRLRIWSLESGADAKMCTNGDPAWPMRLAKSLHTSLSMDRNCFWRLDQWCLGSISAATHGRTACHPTSWWSVIMLRLKWAFGARSRCKPGRIFKPPGRPFSGVSLLARSGFESLDKLCFEMDNFLQSQEMLKTD